MMKILAEKGYLVLNCASAQLFDCVILKSGVGFPVEFKAKRTVYSEEQRERQDIACRKTGNHFIVIRQSHRKGKITVECDMQLPFIELLKHDLEAYL